MCGEGSTRLTDRRQALDRLAAAQTQITALLIDQRLPPISRAALKALAIEKLPRRRCVPWRNFGSQRIGSAARHGRFRTGLPPLPFCGQHQEAG
jgi:hypothetical protein